MKTKNIINLVLTSCIFFTCVFSACEKETETPSLDKLEIYVKDADGNETLVDLNAVPAGEQLKIVVTSDADKAAIWYGGDCNVVESSTGGDTTDIWGNPIIASSGSDCYEHWGLLNAVGRDLVPGEEEGVSTWVDEYFYSYNEGTYTMTIILINDGFDGPDYKQHVEDFVITAQ